jgi:hypothetical protein
MNHKALLATLVLALSFNLATFAEDGERTAPFTAAELEAVYSASIEKRAADILKLLALPDEAKATRVKDAIVAQYRSLRARDAALDQMFQALAQNAPGVDTNRPAVLKILSRQLHDQFLGRLAADLTPEQVEQVKDKMTYNKVKVTYDAYCQIIPKLSEAEKGKILEMLKVAREEAMDGGSADEKTAIFQHHKDQINAMLSANGHDVIKATKEWEAKQAAAKSTASGN